MSNDQGNSKFKAPLNQDREVVKGMFKDNTLLVKKKY